MINTPLIEIELKIDSTRVPDSLEKRLKNKCTVDQLRSVCG
jgi:hypothetical protein